MTNGGDGWPHCVHRRFSAKPGSHLDPAQLAWRRPLEHVGENGEAVEIASLPGGGCAMRNSADGPDGPILFFTRDEWDAFLLGVRDGEFREE